MIADAADTIGWQGGFGFMNGVSGFGSCEDGVGRVVLGRFALSHKLEGGVVMDWRSEFFFLGLLIPCFLLPARDLRLFFVRAASLAFFCDSFSFLSLSAAEALLLSFGCLFERLDDARVSILVEAVHK